MDKRYQVFISSTFTDLQQERNKIYQSILEMDCIPAGMELFPALDEEQFEFIKKIIDDSDYYILIIGGRYGYISPDGVSYTEKEYDYAVSRNIKVIALLHGDPQSIPSGKAEASDIGRERLEQFRKKASTGRLVRQWISADQLPGLVTTSLNRTIKTYPAIGWVRGDVADTTALLTQINELRLENEQLRKGSGSGVKVKTRVSQKFPIENESVSINYRLDGDVNTISLPLSEVFSAIAPSMLARKIDDSVKDVLSNYIHSKRKMSTLSYVSVVQFDFDTVIIKLNAGGLIDFSEHEPDNSNGSVFLKLTDEGIDLLTKIRAFNDIA